MTPPDEPAATATDAPPLPEQTAPEAAATKAAATEAAAGAPAPEQAEAAHQAATAAGLTEHDADVLIDRMEARGLFDRPTPPTPAAAAQPAAEAVEIPPEPPRKLTFAERFRGRR